MNSFIRINFESIKNGLNTQEVILNIVDLISKLSLSIFINNSNELHFAYLIITPGIDCALTCHLGERLIVCILISHIFLRTIRLNYYNNAKNIILKETSSYIKL